MTTLYDRKILNAEQLAVHLALPDILNGIVQPDTISIELDNTDGGLNSLDLRGETFSLSRYDLGSGETLPELNGKIVGQTQLLDRVKLEIAAHDVDVFQTLLPKRLVSSSIFSNVDATMGLNLPIPIIFGNAVGPYVLPLVGEDLVNGYYDYLLGESSPTVVTVFRDTSPGSPTLDSVASSEYTVNDSAYPGYRVLRFTKQQIAFSGGHHTIYATVNGLSTERNFVRAIQTILSNSTWGLGLSVNTTSFDAAAAVLDAIGGLYCDGVINEQRPALDILNELLMVRGMVLKKDSSGAWTISVEQDQSLVQAQFGHGKNQIWQNVIQFNGLSRTPLSNSVKTLYLDFLWQPQANKYQLSVSRSVLSSGQERRIPNPFIADTTTADKTVDFLSKRLLHGDQTIQFSAGQEARALQPGDLIRYNAPDAGISNINFQLRSISRQIGQVALEGWGWSSGIFQYTAGTLPTAPGSATDTAYGQKTPTAVTSLSVVGSGTETDGQGNFLAFQTLQYNVASEAWAQTIVRQRRNGASNWETTAVNQTMGNSLQTKITGLITGLSYDYQVSRVNVLSPSLSADSTLTNIVAPGDSTAPSAPSAIAIRQGTGKVIEIAFTITEPADWGDTLLYRHTANFPNSASLIESAKKKIFHDTNMTFGAQYYYWGKVRDLTALAAGQTSGTNVSTFSPGGNITLQQVLTADIANLAVDTSQINNTAITTAKRQLLNSQSLTHGVNSGSVYSFDFSADTNNLFQHTVVRLDATAPSCSDIYGFSGGYLRIGVWDLWGAPSSYTVAIYYW